MNSKLSERLKVIKGLDPVADALSGTVYSDVVSLALYDEAMFILHKGVGATGTSTITVQAGTDSDCSNAEAVEFTYRRVASGDTAGAITAATTSGFTTSAQSSELYLIEVDPAKLPEAKPWVRVKAVESADSPVVASILALLGDPKYGGATLPTAIA